MKYKVEVSSNFNTVEFESDSRNSIQHLRNNGGHMCLIKNKSGKVISAAGYTSEDGYFHINPWQE